MTNLFRNKWDLHLAMPGGDKEEEDESSSETGPGTGTSGG